MSIIKLFIEKNYGYKSPMLNIDYLSLVMDDRLGDKAPQDHVENMALSGRQIKLQ